MKLKTRFAVLFSAVVGLLHIVLSIAVYFEAVSFRENEFIDKLKDRAILLTQLVVEFDDFNHRIFKQFSSRPHFMLDDEHVTIYNLNKELLFTNRPELNSNFSQSLFNRLQEQKTFVYKKHNKDGIALKVIYNGKPYFTFIDAYDFSKEEKLSKLRLQLFLFLIIGIVFISLIGIIFAHQISKPIIQLITQLRQTNVSNLTSGININRTDEIGELAQSYNQMIDRLNKGFNSQKLFISNASHELRTPLASIKNIIQVALSQPRSENYYKNLLDKLLEQINRIIKLSNSLLDLTKVTGDVSNIIFKKEDLNEIIWHTREYLMETNPTYTIQIQYEQVNQEEELVFMGNNYLLQLMFINVLENACKFSDNNTALVFITKTNYQLTIEIKDNGIGIPENELSKITEPAYRGSNAYGKPGNGLGLAIVKSVAQLHNIQFNIQSKLNWGTTVRFQFELSKA
jgi:signal transduction histidine kinase